MMKPSSQIRVTNEDIQAPQNKQRIRNNQRGELFIKWYEMKAVVKTAQHKLNWDKMSTALLAGTLIRHDLYLSNTQWL